MKHLFSLGDIHLSDFPYIDDPINVPEPLTMVLDEDTKSVRLSKIVDQNRMYGKYWYRSGINMTMTNELKSIAEDVCQCIPIESGDIFLDIACNDGTLLKFVPDNMIKVGIDPADDSYTSESRQIADTIIQDFFSKEVYQSKYYDKKAKIITCIAMFYDLDNPIKFLEDIYEIMDDEGLFVVQMSYTPLMLRQLAFDNICHEHVYYHSMESMKYFLDQTGFTIVDTKLNDINGGSFRLYIRKNIANKNNFKTSPYRDVAQCKIDALLQLEKVEGVNTVERWNKFWNDIVELRSNVINFLTAEKAKGKTIYGYGASTKGNTLLQWFGLDSTIITGIAERNPYKWGRVTVGSNIPILSEDDVRAAKPDYMIVLPWHFIHEFTIREKEYLKSGGKFIVPCPEFKIIGL